MGSGIKVKFSGCLCIGVHFDMSRLLPVSDRAPVRNSNLSTKYKNEKKNIG